MSELPKGWAECTIEDVLGILPSGKQLDQGWSPRCENFPSASEETWGALKTTAIQDGWFEAEHTKQLPDHLDPKPELEVKLGDVLLTCAGPRVRCGVICRVDEVRRKLFISGKMYRFRPDERIVEPDYLMALLRSPDQKKAIDQIKTGGSESGLNLTQARFKALKVPFPPLPEQRRIVRKLDTLSARTTTARTHLTAIEKLVERYKAGVLLQELSGAPLGLEPNVENSQPIKDDKERGSWGFETLPRNWHWAGFREFFVNRSDSHRKLAQISYETEGPYPVIDQGAALVGGYCSDEEMLLPAEPPYIIFGDHTRCVKFFDVRFVQGADGVKVFHAGEGVDIKFAFWALRGLQLPDKGYSRHSKFLKESFFPVPEPEEQREIVRRIEAAFAKIDRLAAEAEKALKLTDRLDQRILAKAFAGALVSQDPSDEPATNLLARIREARATDPKSKRGRRKKVAT